MTEQRLPQPDMNSTSPLSSSLVASRRSELGAAGVPMYREQALQQQIMQLKQQQHLQQQILLQQFQVQQQQLAEQHQKQLQEFLEQQKKLEEEARADRERREKERLLALKNKEKREQSAVASSEVKQRLQEFVLNKKQREAAAAAAAANGLPPSSASVSSPPYRAWTGAVPTMPVGTGHKATPLQLPGPGPGIAVPGPSGSSMSHTLGTAPHPYRHPLLSGNYDDDFPLRKTASEPNLLKMRYKHRIVERRCSPLVRRRDAHGRHPPPAVPPAHTSVIAAQKRMSQLASETGGSTPDSGASSPLSSHAMVNSHSSSGTVPVPEQQTSPSQYGQILTSQGSISDLTLYTSPSLPNISLGRPAINNTTAETSRLTTVSEADVRAALAARMNIPMGGHLLPGGLPYYPPLPGLDSNEYGSSPESPAFIQKQMQFLEQAGHSHILMGGLYPGAPITDAQVAQARLNKSGLRPLGRTQSAPLPLGHPLLQGPPGAPPIPLTQQQYDQYLRDRQIYEQQQQQQQHNLLKQHIRQTVLTRAGSRSQVENVEEETEAAVAREMSRDRIPLPEIIDLTEHKVEEEDDSRASQYPSGMDDRDVHDGLPPTQHRNVGPRATLQSSSGSAFSRTHHIARPLSRAFSSPLVSLNPAANSSDSMSGSASSALNATLMGAPIGVAKSGGTSTALAYDALMLRHQCMCGNNSAHPEHGGRLQSIWARLQETSVVHRCLRLRPRKATLEELQSVHSEAYTLLFGTNPANRQKLDTSRFAELPMKSFVMLPCGGIGVDSDTTWNEMHTPSAARMAAGCVIDLAFKAATGEIKNGFAIVRPPGHHAETEQAMGFCFFNSVAVAAKQLRLKQKLERILIVDWDVHHGNGTQQIFYDDPHVLYISIHRHDDGHFFPGTGNPVECGSEDGLGFNVNIAWSGGLNPPLGDAEYLAAFRTLVMPIAQDFDPEIVLVSAGFDAAMGHPSPLGGYQVSAACFGYMTRQLMQLANGKVILALEGGYDLPAICDASHECIRALLADEPTAIRREELARRPCQNAVDTLHKSISIQLPHWPVVKRYAFSACLSAIEAERVARGEASAEGEDNETLTAMAGLSVCRTNSNNSITASSTSREPSQEPMDQDESK